MTIKYHHKRNFVPNSLEISGKGGVTIAYEEQENNTVKYAVAKCHETENFKKSQGRVKSAGRLNSPKHMIVFEGDAASLIQYIERTPNSMIGV